ncbi:MAG: type II toxin-antitoxin system VapC family toxin [Candidatus Binataceae bacterium]
MITAVDTNVLIDVFGADKKFGLGSASALRLCLSEGALIASSVVWAETATVFDNLKRFRDAMRRLPVSFSPMNEDVAVKAAETWTKYRASGGPRIRIVADFLIGAHAMTCADRLLTRDRGFYRHYFAGLRMVDPVAKPND